MIVQYQYNSGGDRTSKLAEGKTEVLYVDRLYQLQIGVYKDCITKHIFVGETRIVSKITYEDLVNNAEVEQSNTYFYHPDHLGSSNIITDNNGYEYEHLEYTPYGETWFEESQEPMLNKIAYKFTGKELDTETGLYYFGARYYDPKTSRWISADPIYDGVRDGLSIYMYCRNNPIIYHDPNGLEANEWAKNYKSNPNHKWKYSGDYPKSKKSTTSKSSSDKHSNFTGQKEYDFLGGSDYNSNFFCLANAIKNAVMDGHKEINGDYPTEEEVYDAFKKAASNNDNGMAMTYHTHNNGKVKHYRGYTEPSKLANFLWAELENKKGSWGVYLFDNYDSYLNALKELKTNENIIPYTIISFDTNYGFSHKNLTIKFSPDKKNFNFVDSWNGAIDKRSLYDKTNKKWYSVTGPLQSSDIITYYILYLDMSK